MLLPAPRSLTENPWFWVALFGGMGMLGVVVIGPKFSARMARVERMQETRERVAIERAQREAQGGSGANGEGTPVAKPAGSDTQAAEAPEHEPYVESDFRPSTSLKYLLALMTFMMLVGTSGLIVSRARERRAVAAADTSASSSDPPEPPQS